MQFGRRQQVRLNWFNSNLIGGVRLLVPQHQAAKLLSCYKNPFPRSSKPAAQVSPTFSRGVLSELS